MLKTISEISKELEVTNQAVRKKINKIDGFKDQYVTKNDSNFMVVNEYGLIILKKEFLVNQDQTQSQKQEKKEKKYTIKNKIKKEKNDKDEIPYSFFLSQLKEKDEQLQQKDKQINDLSNLLDHSQQLQLNDSQENQALKKRIQELGGYLEYSDDDNQKEKDVQTANKKGFFAKLFHKKD